MLEFIPTRPGGDLKFVSNLEYRIPLVKSYVTLTLFNDFAVNGILRKSQLQLDPAATSFAAATVSESRFSVPTGRRSCVNIPNNLPIAPGTNFHAAHLGGRRD